MLAALVHRGPDDEGILAWRQMPTAGMRRLSIIDLPGGGQPVWNETRTVARLLQRRNLQFPRTSRRTRILRPQISAPSQTPKSSFTPTNNGARNARSRFHGMFAFAIVEMPQGAASPASRKFFSPATRWASSRFTTQAPQRRKLLFSLRKYALCSPAGKFRRSISATALPVVFAIRFGRRTLHADRRTFAPFRPATRFLDFAAAIRTSSPTPKAYWNPASEFRCTLPRTVLSVCCHQRRIASPRCHASARCSKIPFAAT